MKIWQKILNGKGDFESSTEIEKEIQALTEAGRRLEANLPELEKTLEKARTDLLAETPGSMDKVTRAEGAISETRNKSAAIKSVVKNLNVALEKAFSSETIKRQAEITREISAIGDKISKLQKEALSHFSKAAIITNQIFGNERLDHRLSYGFFLDCNLSEELSRQIEAGISEQEGLSLYTRREQLTRMSEQLSKKSL